MTLVSAAPVVSCFAAVESEKESKLVDRTRLSDNEIEKHPGRLRTCGR